ncbi:rna-directed dna polymerase from mobile element jockey-like [Pitangus sulphuratus]|nr:rna-directed dna polymerase from mobile element jockey-like [Pitangus sulphuratus]
MVVVNDSKSQSTSVTSGVPQGPVLGNTFINDKDEGIECTLTKFADDTKLSVVADTPEQWDAIQRDLDKLEKWVHGNLMQFNKTKCKVLHLGWGSPQYQYRLWDEQVESSPAEKDLGVLLDERLDTNWQCESQPYPGLHPGVETSDSAPLLCSGETLPGVLQTAMGSPAQEGH